MGGSRSNTAKDFANLSMDRSRKMFASGFPLFQKGIGMSQDAQRTGEPEFLGRALDAALSNAQDAGAMQSGAAADMAELGEKGAIGGGNTSRALSGEDLGAKLAQFVRNSSSQRQTARISQILDAAGVGVGQMGSAGELQTRALSNQLGAISMMPTQDPNVTRALSAVNLGMSVYGAGNGTWWNQNPTTAQGTINGFGQTLKQPLPLSAIYGTGSALLQPLPQGRRY